MSKERYNHKLQTLASLFFFIKNDRSEKWALKKTTSNLFRPRSTGKRDRKLDLSHFNQLITIEKEKLFAEVEGLTTYEEIVAKTLKAGCLPTVVPELKTITAGGAIAGCGIESSSFRYGLVHETVQEMDILLSSGKVVTCTPENEYRDLFYAFPNTYGTLGYLLRAKVQLVPVKAYVKLRHLKFTDPELFLNTLTKACDENQESGPFDFIEGVVFDPNTAVITLGEFSNSAPYVNKYDREKIYYLSLKEREEDYLTVSDYIWRWDPDWFWCSRVFYMQNPFIRRLFGNWMLHSGSYAKIMHFFKRHTILNRLAEGCLRKRESVIQDISIPVENGKRFLEWFHSEIGIKPIWVCPTRCRNEVGSFDFCPLEKGKLYFDFGFWDSLISDHEPGYFNRKLEALTKRMHGFKSLYSTSYYTEDEFWQLYDRVSYERLKMKYDPEGNFRTLFEKCTKRD